jgi:hypothetical protein
MTRWPENRTLEERFLSPPGHPAVNHGHELALVLLAHHPAMLAFHLRQELVRREDPAR